MVRLRLLALALLTAIGLAGSVHAASTVDSLAPVLVFPLLDPGVTTEHMWITQGGIDYNIIPTKAGYIYQGTCSTLLSPYKYQYCIDTTTAPLSTVQMYDGAQWVPFYTIDTTNHLYTPPDGGGTIPTVASAATTDLCAGTPQSAVSISGAVSISSFGPTCARGVRKWINFTSSPTVIYNASSMILPGAGNITVSANETWVVQALGGGNWQLYFRQPGTSTGVTSVFGRTGAVVAQSADYQFSQITGVANNTQLPTMAPVGSSINIAGTLAAPNTSVVVTADGITVGTALNGVTYTLGSYSQTFNSSISGAGGMDIAPLPGTGNVCIYAIYNPTLLSTSILGVNCSTSSGTIYSGAHQPAGYTASALLGSWPTNGTPAMVAGQLQAPPFPASNGKTPAGSVMFFAGSTAPLGWLFTDGSAVSRTTYANLFLAIGTTYGVGDGATTFNLPDTRGRFVAGFDSANATGRLTASATAGVSALALNNSGGQQAHTPTLAEMFAHTHTITDPGHTHTINITDPGHAHTANSPVNNSGSFGTGAQPPSASNSGTINNQISQVTTTNTTGITATASSATTGITAVSAGSSTPFNVVPPALIMNYIIKF